jgi:hypothetical protein
MCRCLITNRRYLRLIEIIYQVLIDNRLTGFIIFKSFLGTNLTPQVKRKHSQAQVPNVPVSLLTDQLEGIHTMLQDMNRKIETMAKMENDVEKRLSNVDKRLGGLVRQVNKVCKTRTMQMSDPRYQVQNSDSSSHRLLSFLF